MGVSFVFSRTNHLGVIPAGGQPKLLNSLHIAVFAATDGENLYVIGGAQPAWLAVDPNEAVEVLNATT
jgi:hypothetical protein